MSRAIFAFALSLAVLGAPGPAGAERSRDFRYERGVPSAVATGRVAFEPDGLMLAHTKPGLADLRVVDARGADVPWRRVPREQLGPRPARMLNSGQRGGLAVALVDLGAQRRSYDRIELEISGSEFLGRVTVLGADRRVGPFTRLSTTRIYDVSGATRARSTAALIPLSDFRYLELRAQGVTHIDGAVVSAPLERPRLVRRRHGLLGPHRQGDTSVLSLDFGVSGVPVSRLEVRASTPRYDRRVIVEGSNDGRAYVAVAAGRTRRDAGSLSPPLTLDSRYRFLRVNVRNGDDPPLSGLRVETFGPSFAVIVEPGSRPPLRVRYGGPSVAAPRYEFARLSAARPSEILDPSRLGPERLNPAFVPPADTRSFVDRHDWLVQLAIVFAALAVGAVGLFALRRRA
jgi:hypothetical protein